MRKFSTEGNNKQAVQTAQYVVNKFFNKNFELKECVKQVHLLRQKHSTFSTIMLCDDLGWSLEINSINCNPKTWENIMNDDPFACAYAKYSDPHWEDLQVIFYPPMNPNSAPPQVGADHEVIVIDDNIHYHDFPNKYTPLNEVIDISSDKSGSLSTNFWNELRPCGNSSDNDGSFRSPSLKMEMSSSNPPTKSREKGKKFGDNICVSLYGASYVSSSSHASPNLKK